MRPTTAGRPQTARAPARRAGKGTRVGVGGPTRNVTMPRVPPTRKTDAPRGQVAVVTQGLAQACERGYGGRRFGVKGNPHTRGARSPVNPVRSPSVPRGDPVLFDART